MYRLYKIPLMYQFEYLLQLLRNCKNQLYNCFRRHPYLAKRFQSYTYHDIIIRICKYNSPEYLSNFERNCILYPLRSFICISPVGMKPMHNINIKEQLRAFLCLSRITIQSTLDDEWSRFKTLG